jgi:hypothetical protein
MAGTVQKCIEKTALIAVISAGYWGRVLFHVVSSYHFKELILEFERGVADLERQMTKLVALRRARYLLSAKRHQPLGFGRRGYRASRRASRRRPLVTALPRPGRLPVFDDSH